MLHRLVIIVFNLSIGFVLSADTAVLNLNHQPYRQHAYYGYRSVNLSDVVHIYEDSLRSSSIHELLEHTASFHRNDTPEYFNRAADYWVTITVNNDQKTTQDYLFEFGHQRISCWGEVDVWLVEKDSIYAHYRTGIDLKLKELSLRTATNLVKVAIPSGEFKLVARLHRHHTIAEDPKWQRRFGSRNGKVEVFLHELASYYAIDGYQYPGFFTEARRGFIFNNNYFKECLEIVADPEGIYDEYSIKTIWDEKADFLYDVFADPGVVYWMRFKIYGTPQYNGSYLFGLTTGTQWNYDRIEVFTTAVNGELERQLTGNQVAKAEKEFGTDWNLFSVAVGAQDTQVVYLKLVGANDRFVPEFAMAHIDADSFWSRIFSVQSIYGAFIGILIVQAFYFFIVGFIEKETVHFWFVCLIIGFLLALLFVGGDVNYFVFTSMVSWHPWITGLGAFMMVLGLFKYIEIYLSLDDYLPFSFSKLSHPLLLLHGLICLYFGYSLYSIGGNIAVFEPYFQALFASCIINFLIGIALGIYTWIKGNAFAKYFVGAFAALVIILVVRLTFAFGSFTTSDGFKQSTILVGLYAHYFLFAGIIATIVLLGFGNGYRINLLKNDRRRALLQVDENSRVTKLLKDQNIEIQKRAAENEILVKEVHHRVKNNLQILASLLSLQSDYISDEQAREAIQESKNRVDAMGLIHQMLYRHENNISAIYMPDYLDKLSYYLREQYEDLTSELVIICNTNVDLLDLDTATPIGMTISELVTNSIKHAFVEDQARRILIDLRLTGSEKLVLTVSDNGQRDKRVNTEDSASFGSKLMYLLSKRLKGEIFVDQSEGYKTEIVYYRFKHLDRRTHE